MTTSQDTEYRPDGKCRKCGQPTMANTKGRIRSFCSRECEAAWRSEFYRGNKFRVGLKPSNAFKPGHATWNKGVKGTHFSPATEFKPGNTPAVVYPIGTVTIRADKNGRERAWVKVANPDVWVLRSVLNWIAAGNPIPSGYVVHHEDRDTLNDHIDNLRCGDRASHIEEHRRELAAAKRNP